LTSAQVVEIYTGATSSWLAFQGSDRPITVINKEEGRATLELFENFFKLKGKFVGTAIIIGPNGQAIQTVAGNPDSIAYVSIGSATVAEAQGTTIKRVSLDGVEATVETVSAGKYPLSRELTLTTKGPASGLAREFMDFMLSSDGQAIVQAEDFVPVGPAIKTTSGN
jgi:phosphate transport system substrate-binding protein